MATLKANPKKSTLPEVAKALDDKIGRPTSDPFERSLKAAAANALSGEMSYTAIENLYQISQNEIQTFINKLFPDDNDKFLFLEQVAQQNATLAASVFTAKFTELTAIDAAKAFAIFSSKALDIRKAREMGFKEPPIPIQTLQDLQKTLARLRPEKSIDAVEITPEHAPKQQPQTPTEEKKTTTKAET